MPLMREDVRSLCAVLKGATSDYPFGPEAQVFRVGGKIFALLSETDERLSLKCDPALAEILRQNFVDVIPGYHLNKRHWNTVVLGASVPDSQIEELVRHSYEIVLSSLSKKARASIIGSA